MANLMLSAQKSDWLCNQSGYIRVDNIEMPYLDLIGWLDRQDRFQFELKEKLGSKMSKSFKEMLEDKSLEAYHSYVQLIRHDFKWLSTGSSFQYSCSGNKLTLFPPESPDETADKIEPLCLFLFSRKAWFRPETTREFHVHLCEWVSREKEQSDDIFSQPGNFNGERYKANLRGWGIKKNPRLIQMIPIWEKSAYDNCFSLEAINDFPVGWPIKLGLTMLGNDSV